MNLRVPRQTCATVFSAAVAACIPFSIAFAQTPSTPAPARDAAASSTKWEIEAHWGGAFANAPAGATALPNVGVPFTTFTGFPSRTIPSWYFGDGAALANERAAIGGNPTMAALDK